MKQSNSSHYDNSQTAFPLFYILFCFLLDLSLSMWFESYSIMFCGTIGSLLVAALTRNLDDNVIGRLCLLKLFGIFFVLLIYYGNIHAYGVPYYIGGSDDVKFEFRANRMILKGFNWPWSDDLITNSRGFNWVLCMIMKACKFLHISYHTACFRVMNIDLLLATGVLVYRIGYIRLNMKKRIARNAMTIMCLFPNAVYISSFIFRDTLSVLMTVLFFICTDDIFRTGEDPPILISSRPCNVFIILNLIFWGYWLRGELLYIMILIIGISFLRNEEMKGKKFAIMMVMLTIVVVIFYQIGAVDSFLFKTDSAYNYHHVEDGSSSLSRVIFNMPIVPLGLILRIVYGVVFPIPVGLLKVSRIFTDGLILAEFIVSLGMCVQIACIPILVRNTRHLDKYTITFLSIFLIIVISSYTFRHFILVYPFAILMILREYYSMPRVQANKSILLGFGALMMGALMYLVAK
ncbi:hypothetical protein [[Clostridium] polysaccharolyticum]|uniref:hypothetical protein n=1 Tax=[Clostridium] polysaccharolyticum TaxID=29364 RepID=UPI00115FD3F8|nr:hypothetical protein [[Clostridium] polysaccharolyticum]